MYIDNTHLVLLSSDDNSWICSHSFDEIESFGGIDSEKWKSFEPLFDDEVWKSASICGYDYYYVSNYGRIYQTKYKYSYVGRSGVIVERKQPARIVRNVLSKNYYICTLYKQNHKKAFVRIHRLVCYVFNTLNRPDNFDFIRTSNYNIVDHIDTNQKNNIATNLIWSNYLLNMNNSNSKKKMSNTKQKSKHTSQKYYFDYYEGNLNDDVSNFIPNESSRWFSLIDFKGEIWKEIPGFRNAYASNYGRIKKEYGNKKDNALCIPHYTLGNHGYFIVYLNNHPYTVHRIVYMSFHNDIDNNKVIDHIDTVRTNNNISNLRQVLQSQNTKNELSIEKNRKSRTPSTMKPVVLYSLVTGERLGEF
jgi:hypothetical protein